MLAGGQPNKMTVSSTVKYAPLTLQGQESSEQSRNVYENKVQEQNVEWKGSPGRPGLVWQTEHADPRMGGRTGNADAPQECQNAAGVGRQVSCRQRQHLPNHLQERIAVWRLANGFQVTGLYWLT